MNRVKWRERERERCTKEREEMMSSSKVLKAAPSNGGPVHCHQSWDKVSKREGGERERREKRERDFVCVCVRVCVCD